MHNRRPPSPIRRLFIFDTYTHKSAVLSSNSSAFVRYDRSHCSVIPMSVIVNTPIVIISNLYLAQLCHWISMYLHPPRLPCSPIILSNRQFPSVCLSWSEDTRRLSACTLHCTQYRAAYLPLHAIRVRTLHCTQYRAAHSTPPNTEPHIPLHPIHGRTLHWDTEPHILLHPIQGRTFQCTQYRAAHSTEIQGRTLHCNTGLYSLGFDANKLLQNNVYINVERGPIQPQNHGLH